MSVMSHRSYEAQLSPWRNSHNSSTYRLVSRLQQILHGRKRVWLYSKCTILSVDSRSPFLYWTRTNNRSVLWQEKYLYLCSQKPQNKSFYRVHWLPVLTPQQQLYNCMAQSLWMSVQCLHTMLIMCTVPLYSVAPCVQCLVQFGCHHQSSNTEGYSYCLWDELACYNRVLEFHIILYSCLVEPI